jgi:O-antigen ligase
MSEKIFKVSKLISEYSIFGILFFLPISISLLNICSVFLLLSFVTKKIINPNFKFIRFWPNIFLILFFIFIGLSLINSGQYIYKSLWAWLAKWFQFIATYLIVQDTLRERKLFKQGTMIFLFSSLLVVLSGLSQRFLGWEFLRHRNLISADGFLAVTSSFHHYNSLGAYLVVAISLARAVLINGERSNRQKLFISVFLMLSISVIVLTFSRGSWLALLFSFLFFSIFGKERKKTMIFAVGFLIFLFTPLYKERLLFTFAIGGDKGRFEFWSAALKMITENPFLGKGAGTFMDYFSKYLPQLYPAYAHNCYLQIWAETGVFSLINFLIYAGSLLWLGIRKYLRTKDNLLLGFLSGFSAYLVHSFFDIDLYSVQLAVLFWVWAAFVSVFITEKELEK